MKILSFFSIFGVIFALLDPDPDPQFVSGSETLLRTIATLPLAVRRAKHSDWILYLQYCCFFCQYLSLCGAKTGAGTISATLRLLHLTVNHTLELQDIFQVDRYLTYSYTRVAKKIFCGPRITEHTEKVLHSVGILSVSRNGKCSEFWATSI